MLRGRANPRPLDPTNMGGPQEEKWPQICSNSKHKKVHIVSGGGGGGGGTQQQSDGKSRKRAILLLYLEYLQKPKKIADVLYG